MDTYSCSLLIISFPFQDQLETEREENLKTMSEMNSTIEEIKCNLHKHKEKLNLELVRKFIVMGRY